MYVCIVYRHAKTCFDCLTLVCIYMYMHMECLYVHIFVLANHQRLTLLS